MDKPITKHTEAFVEVARSYPEMFKYGAVGPYGTTEEFLSTFYYPLVQEEPGLLLFLLIDKTKPTSTTVGLVEEDGAVAGHLAYINSSTIYVFSRCSHVMLNAIGFMMHYALNILEQGGLGLRRVFWQVNELDKSLLRLVKIKG